MAKKKRNAKKLVIILASVTAVAVAAVLILPGLLGRRNTDAGANLATAVVTKGDIATTVVGTGNIGYDDAMDVKIPNGLKIKEVLVSAGDTVDEGDVLATVDETSLASKTAEVRETIESLDNALDNAESGSKYIKAGTSGRVEKINAASGDSVHSVMSEKGCLITLSLDGTMSADIETENAGLSAGDEVTAVLSDGTELEGEITAVGSSGFTVKVTDNGTDAGAGVTIKSKEGTQLGTGTLYITRPLEIVGTTGTVSSVNVSENDKVSSGTKVITLTEAPVSADYEQNYVEREEQKDILSALMEIAKTNSIVSDFSGTIESVNIADGVTGSSGSTDDGSTVSNVSADYDSEGLTAALLSDTEVSASVTDITDLSGLAITAPAAGEKPQATVAEQTEYTGIVTWNPSHAEFEGETAYTATVMLTAKAGYKFAQGIAPVFADGVVGNITLSGDTEKNVLGFTVTYPATAAAEETEQPAESAQPTEKAEASQNTRQQSQEAAKASGGSSAGGGGTASAAGDTSITAASSDSTEESSEIVAFTAVVSDNVALTVSIDELDILSVQEGQEAAVTLDAVEGKTFTGTITNVAEAASEGGNVATYSVEISLGRDDSIKIGMSASATITIDKAEDTLRIPMDALQEDEDGAYVYKAATTSGEAMGEKVSVETGISDGDYVQILSGLSEGDVVAYIAAVSEENEDRMMSMMQGMNMGGGGMPGGERPDNGQSGSGVPGGRQ